MQGRYLTAGLAIGSLATAVWLSSHHGSESIPSTTTTTTDTPTTVTTMTTTVAMTAAVGEKYSHGLGGFLDGVASHMSPMSVVASAAAAPPSHVPSTTAGGSGTSSGVPAKVNKNYALVLPQLLPARFETATAKVVMRWGYPSTENLKFRGHYVLSYDRRNRVPNWVAEHINKSNLKGPANRSSSVFLEDDSDPELFRAHLSDYYKSGYDRGHMRPAANAKVSDDAMEETFFLSNIAPQVGEGFNRDYWARLELYVRDLALSHDNVWCVTGPLYLPKKESDGKWRVTYEVIGNPPSVAVPTHFYKVVLTESASTGGGAPIYKVAAFVMPNAPIPVDTPLSAYVVPVNYVERTAGLEFFPNLPKLVQYPPIPLCGSTGRDCVLPAPDAWKKGKALPSKE